MLETVLQTLVNQLKNLVFKETYSATVKKSNQYVQKK